jgi:hypothetical protein
MTKENAMTYSAPIILRTEDLLRHVQDLRTGTYEGAVSQSEKEVVYRRGVELLSPVALAVLEAANAAFLNGTGQVLATGPQNDGYGGLEARFELSWPEQRAAWVVRGPREPLQPVRIVAHYHRGFHHPHLGGSRVGDWPFQITSPADAERQAGVLAAIVEVELHQRIYETDWRILPVTRQGEENK